MTCPAGISPTPVNSQVKRVPNDVGTHRDTSARVVAQRVPAVGVSYKRDPSTRWTGTHGADYRERRR